MDPSGGFLVYTDGSCYTGDRVGAWAFVAIDVDGNEELQGEAAHDTTISRMELSACLAALLWLYAEYGPSVAMVYSDSEYVVLGITDRARVRRKNNDLWNELDAIVDAHEMVAFEHVKGHNNDHYNEMVDGHAGKLRKAASHEKP